MPMLDADASTFRAVEELKRIYKAKVLPLESMYKYEDFYTQSWTDSDFDGKPQVMIVGPYSAGKTTFIKQMIGRDYPGGRIGPEPTTDRFIVVHYGSNDRTIPGNTLALKKDLPYRGLEKFGVAFLNRFEGAQVNSESLRNLNLIDTPGVLTGEKQNQRGYNFNEIIAWFAVRVDVIIVMFDTMKVEISDEFRDVLDTLAPTHDKIRCILNKADAVDKQKLFRIYGALMWNLGKIIKTPESLRVYVGTFWDQPLVFDENAALFQAEQRDLMKELLELPRNVVVRKINELVKRIRTVKIHSYLIGHLKDQMPTFGKKKKMENLIRDMESVYEVVQSRYNLNMSDFPPIAEFQDKLRGKDMAKFSALKPQLIEQLEVVTETDIPRLLESLPGVSFNVSDGAASAELLNLLGKGIIVLKHGRKGSPKERLIRCNPAVTRLYWSSDVHSRDLPGDEKSIALRDVVEIRRGNDPDPDHPGLYGTATLRRHQPKATMLENCLSLILRDRSLDLECHSNDDFFALFSNLQKQCLALKAQPPGATAGRR